MYMCLNPDSGYLIHTNQFNQAARFDTKKDGTGIFMYYFADDTLGGYGGCGLSASGSNGLGAFRSSAGWRFQGGGMQCCDIVGTCACKDQFVNILNASDKTVYCSDDARRRSCKVKVHKVEADQVVLEIVMSTRPFGRYSD